MTADDLVTVFGIASVKHFDIKFDDLQLRCLSFPFENRKLLGRRVLGVTVCFVRTQQIKVAHPNFG